MRIVVVNNFYPPRVGGSALLSDNLARGYARAGHEVLVITAAYQDGAAVEEPMPGLRIVRLPSLTMPDVRLAVTFDLAFTIRPSLLRRVSRLLKDFRPDVIHQHGQFFDLTWATAAYARRHKIPTLLTVHTRLENPSPTYGAVFRFLDSAVVLPILRWYRPRIEVLDVQMEEYIQQRYRKAISGLEYGTVGLETAHMVGGDPGRVRQLHGLGTAPLIVSLGHVIPLRDRRTLIEAMPEVLAEFPDAKLVVVGHVYYASFLERAKELGIDHAVLAVGAVPNTDVPDYLAAADVEIHDLQGYGIGISTLESMAAGVPVVAAVRKDHFRGIDLSDACQLVPVGDAAAVAEALLELLRDPELRKRQGERGSVMVRKEFAIERVIAHHLEILTSMVPSAAARTIDLRVAQNAPS
jgi:glycosyltransferase involved in cell wall biosynthesis